MRHFVTVSEASEKANLTRQRINQMIFEKKIAWRWKRGARLKVTRNGSSYDMTRQVRLVCLEDVMKHRRPKTSRKSSDASNYAKLYRAQLAATSRTKLGELAAIINNMYKQLDKAGNRDVSKAVGPDLAEADKALGDANVGIANALDALNDVISYLNHAETGMLKLYEEDYSHQMTQEELDDLYD
jgi:hypothetical protein